MGLSARRLGVVSLLALAGPACANEQTAIPGKACVVNSDCNAPLVCTYGLCHEACRDNGDCPSLERCVWSASGGIGRVRVCLLAEPASCALNSQCTPDLVCGRDLQCRNECVEDRDCADDEDRCLEAGVNGEKLCLDPAAIVDGRIVDHTGTGVGGLADATVADATVEDGAVAADAATDAVAGGSVGEVEPNDEATDANLYVVGTRVRGCICERSDTDWYALSVPAGDAAGGYFSVSITDVGDGAIFANLYTAGDHALLGQFQSLVRGESHHFYFAGEKGRTYDLEVLRAGLSAYTPFGYTLEADYVKVDDPFEPNDTRDDPAALALSATVMPYFYAGLRQRSVDLAAYEDWFVVDLAAGQATVDLDDVPLGLRLRFRVYDEGFAQLSATGQTAPSPGAEVHGSFTVMTPGRYRVAIQSVTAVPSAIGEGGVPENFTRPYRLTIAQ